MQRVHNCQARKAPPRVPCDLQVMEEIGHALAIEMLSRTPHGFREQCRVLPLALRPVAAHAAVPALAAICDPVFDDCGTIRAKVSLCQQTEAVGNHSMHAGLHVRSHAPNT